METDPTKSITAFYAGRSIFITGATGFMGKVLVEKLLRSCPDVGEIFLLMRPKKEISIDDRLRKMIALPLFDKLRETNPSAFEKLIPVTGDVGDEGLGLPTIERRVLIEKVSVIFHAAASVRFDDHLKQAILLNTRGTRELCILAANMKKLVVLLHVSTTYSNTNRPVIDEVLYPAHANWKNTIKIAETLDEHTLNVLTAKYLGALPNTYTFAKQLAEHVINDYAGIIPSAIFRPSVVISTAYDPVEGWVDNFNGPVGLMIGGGKGVLRSVLATADSKIDFIPVDLAIKTMLAAAWQRGIITITKDPSIPVYNCASGNMKVIKTGDLLELGLKVVAEIPFDGTLWVPNTTIHTIKFVYTLNFFMFHLFPALIIDSVLKLSGAKPRLISLQRKIYTANVALNYFMSVDWTFKNDKFLSLIDLLMNTQTADFHFDIANMDITTYMRNSAIGAKKFLLKDDMNKIEQARDHRDKMWWIDRAVKLWFGILLSWGAVTSGFLTFISSSISSVFALAH